MLLGVFSFITDLFQAILDFIPKTIYLFYASLASVIDVLQLFFRKLAGLDVYYIDGQAVTGDLVSNFISGIFGVAYGGTSSGSLDYSPLVTVFWSFIVFGVILCFVCTIVALIKSHYSYDDKAAKGPMQYVYSAGKAIINMVAVPVIVVLGLYVSQALLTALDSITSVTNSDLEDTFGSYLSDNCISVSTTSSSSSDETYIFYDLFGYKSYILYGSILSSDSTNYATATELASIGSTNQTFSGSMFKVAAYNANRARLSEITSTEIGTWSGSNENKSGALTLFYNAGQGSVTDYDLFADMIDSAFANNLHLRGVVTLDYDVTSSWVSAKYVTNYLTYSFSSFSKFNVGLVWYFYDLWQFNFIVGFGSIIVSVTLFINIIMGLIQRIFLMLGLFLIAPALFALRPLDEGKATKGWIEQFMKQTLMAYGAVVAMNLFFLLLPYFNQIDFFNIPIADYFAQTLVIIVGLITIKAFIATISGLIGSEDAHKAGEGISQEVASTAGRAVSMTTGAAKFALKGAHTGLNILSGGKLKKAEKKIASGIGRVKNKITGQNRLNEMEQFKAKDDALRSIEGMDASNFNEAEQRAFRKQAREAGMNNRDIDDIITQAKNGSLSDPSTGKLDLTKIRGQVTRDKAYNDQVKSWGNSKVFAQEMRRAQDKRASRVGLAHDIRGLGSEVFGLGKLTTKGDKFMSTFLDDSGISPKPNFEKETAANTAATRRAVEELSKKIDDLKE